MFSVLADGAGRHRLEDGTGTEVGWIRGRSIGFRGLRSEAEAIVAASAGWRTLQSMLHREFAAWPRQEVDWENLRFVNDGAHEWVSDGRIPLARLSRSTDVAAHGRHDVAATDTPRQFAVEFVVPSWMEDEAMIPLAHALWHVLAPLLGKTTHGTTQATQFAIEQPHRRHDHGHDSLFPHDAVTHHEHATTDRDTRRVISGSTVGGTAA